MASVLRARWRGLIQGLWFLPSLIVIVLGALAFGLVQVDEHVLWDSTQWVFGADPNAARTVLSTIAGSLITVAGLTFSVTMVVLQLASSQFSPRVLPNFLGDRLTQLTVGAFVGIFVYCLIGLRAVGASHFVPRLTVTVASGLGVLAVILLIVFIHHVSTMIQVSHIAARIARKTLQQLDSLHPEPYGRAAERDPNATLATWRAAGEPLCVFPSRPGFVEEVSVDALVRALARRGEVRVHVPVAPGEFVSLGSPVVCVWPAQLASGCEHTLRRAITIASERNFVQDVAFGVRQLGDIALRAISPGINDPTTAVTCLGYIRSLLERLAVRRLPAQVREWPDSGVTAVVARREYHHYVSELEEVAGYAGGDMRIVRALFSACAGAAHAAGQVGARDRVEALVAAGGRIAERVAPDLATAADREQVTELLEQLRGAAEPST
jgi:uncharacterized membrane protein